jgi:hypothetical protein
MSEAIGRISGDDKSFAKIALLTFEPAGTPGDRDRYKGSFILSGGMPWPTAGQSFTLATADGRSGQILVERVSTGPRQDTLVFFRTSGPFT